MYLLRMSQQLAALAIGLTCCAYPIDQSLSEDQPTFGSEAKSVADVSLSTVLAPDNRTASIFFDNLTLELASDPIATRVFTLYLPVEDGTTEQPVRIDVRGFVHRDEGAAAAVVLNVNGQPHIVGLPENSDEDFFDEIETTLPASADLRVTIFLSLERNAKDSRPGATLTIDSLDAVLKKIDAE